jgi:recombinational DNA repair protein (RecF pathway)
MFTNLEKMADSNRNVIYKAFNNIIHKCIGNKAIANFVRIVTDPEDSLNHELLVLVAQLGYSINHNSISDCSSVYELSSFLSNINDDFYFYVKQNDRGLINAYAENTQLPNKVSQDVRFLIEAAKKNVDYYEIKDKKRLARLQEIATTIPKNYLI